MFSKRPILNTVLLLIILLAPGSNALCQAENSPLVVFLVRHAEKQRPGSDPSLTEAGKARAEALANVLRDSQISAVHSTNYKRTRATALPFANQISKKVQIYNPRDHRSLIKKIKAAGGRHLVVGHSNTVPALVAEFGGESGRPIAEPTEFDRLYILTFDETGDVTTVLLRIGD